MTRKFIFYRPSEIQGALTRSNWAESLIEQLPQTHDGRNSWLMNYGKKTEARHIRKTDGRNFDYDYKTDSYK